MICHNNLVNNTPQAYSYSASSRNPFISHTPSINVWDDGFEGNYWSNYNGTGSTSYIIDANNQDQHPLTTPYSGQTLYGGQKELTSLVPAITITAAIGVVGGAVPAYFARKQRRKPNNNSFLHKDY
jgi:ABC-type dipeptide/oligopeptide/nickel transport system permease subunit